VFDTEEGKAFLGAIRIIREKPRLASSYLSVPSFRTYQCGSSWQDFQ